MHIYFLLAHPSQTCKISQQIKVIICTSRSKRLSQLYVYVNFRHFFRGQNTMLCLLGRLHVGGGGSQVGLRSLLSRKLHRALASAPRNLSGLQKVTKSNGRPGNKVKTVFDVKKTTFESSKEFI